MDISLTNKLVMEFVAAFEASDLEVLRVRNGEIEIYLSRRPDGNAAAVTVQSPAPTGDPAPPQPASTSASPAAVVAPPAGSASAATDLHVVRAPMIGTLYRRPEPGADPYVVPGARVTSADTVALVEAMKLFTGVTAGAEGVVEEVFVDDSTLVEYGQELMTVRLDRSPS